MRAGRLKDQITIEKRGTTRDSLTNELAESWETHCEPWCEIMPTRAVEIVVDNQVVSRVFYRFRCRHDDVDDVTAAMRISFEGKVYEIQSLLPDIAGKNDIILQAVLINEGT